MTNEVLQEIAEVIVRTYGEDFSSSRTIELTHEIARIVDASMSKVLIESTNFGHILDAVGLTICSKNKKW